MGNNKNDAQLKANIAEFIGPLVRRLKLAKEKFSENPEMVDIINQITTKVVETKSSLDNIVNWNRVQSGEYGKIERKIDDWIDHTDRTTQENHSVAELRDILSKLSHKPGEKASGLPSTANIPELPKSLDRSSQENKLSIDLEENLEKLDAYSSLFLYSLGIFPENAKLKKRFVIYWWTGLGLLPWLSWEKAEEHGDSIFTRLVNQGFLIAEHTREHNKVINLCTINPTIYKWLFSSDKREGFNSPFFGDWFKEKIHVNLDQRYLTSKKISTNQNMQVVQLGNWRYIEKEFYNRVKETGSEKIMSNDHIEVDETDFLMNLREKTIYLSLQGISGIEGVHESVGNLENLMILDLRACHNLNKLPHKPRSTSKEKFIRWKLPQPSWVKVQKIWFKKLAVLDVSECYLLDHMPKWICELSNLEVLKGFVIGSKVNQNWSCRVDDLSLMKKLRKLTIRIPKGHLATEDFSNIKTLEKLLVLTIIWGDNKSNFAIPANSLPDNLEKLDIRCYPDNEASKLLNPAALKNLKRLYIRGGKLSKIPCNEKWKIEILRLKFLKNLDTDWEELTRSFTNLKYVEYVECPMLKNFPKDRSSWSEERDGSFQNANASVTSN